MSESASPDATAAALHSCKNCGNQFVGIVCNECGQHPIEETLSVKALIKEWIYRRTRDYRLFFITTKQLIFHPGKVIREYLGGKRHRYYNAVNYFVLIASLVGFITIQFNSFDPEATVDQWNDTYKQMGVEMDEEAKQRQKLTSAWIGSHMNLILLVAMPFFALASYIIFSRREFNLGEHLILNFYAYGCFSLVTLPLLIIGKPGDITSPFTLASMGIMVLWYAWVFKDTFKISYVKGVLISIFMYILYFLFFMIAVAIITVIVVLAIIGYSLITGTKPSFV